MKKQKKEIFEDKVFATKVEAQEVVDQYAVKNKKMLIGLAIAAVATFLMISGGMASEYSWKLIVGFIGAIVSYCVAGGVGKVFTVATKVAKVGWFIVPIFPADLCVGLVCFILAYYAVIFVPVFYIYLNYRQFKKEYKEAQKYLRAVNRAF